MGKTRIRDGLHGTERTKRITDRPCKGKAVPLQADSHIACRAHAAPLPCRAAKGLECVSPI